jgi:hypothetical protein
VSFVTAKRLFSFHPTDNHLPLYTKSAMKKCEWKLIHLLNEGFLQSQDVGFAPGKQGPLSFFGALFSY